MIVAKTIVPNQFWILKDGDEKIGNIEASPAGFDVKIKDQIRSFKSISTIKQKVEISFEPAIKKSKESHANKVHGYPTNGKPHNAIYDVKHQVPLWTRDPRSKSWYAAGWYQVKQGRNWSVEFCPKLITLQRYPYAGPFYTKEEANDQPIS